MNEIDSYESFVAAFRTGQAHAGKVRDCTLNLEGYKRPSALPDHMAYGVAHVDFVGVRFEGAWSHIEFGLCTFKGCTFSDQYWRDVRFASCDFERCEFRNVRFLAGSKWHGGSVADCSFRGCRLIHSMRMETDVLGCTFEGMSGFFDSCKLTIVGMLHDTTFEGARQMLHYDLDQAHIHSCAIPGEAELLSEMGFRRAPADDGWIAYKTFGAMYPTPSSWRLIVGGEIREPMLNEDRKRDCAAGINVGNVNFVINNSAYSALPSHNVWDSWGKPQYWLDVWELFIPDDATICVPYSSDGKWRTDKAVLLRNLGPANELREAVDKGLW